MVAYLRAERLQPTEAVEELELRCRLQERQVLGLPVNVQQKATQRRYRVQRDGPTIHPPDAPPAGADVPRKDEVQRAGIRRLPIVVGIEQPSFRQERVQGRRWLGEGEHRLDVRVRGPGADIIRSSATAEHAADRVNNDGLPGAGLAGQDVEAGTEPDMHVGQQCKVLDGQLVQHGALSSRQLSAVS